MNLRYEDSTLPRPPSIYLAKRAGDVGYTPQGLTTQLTVLADSTAKILRQHLAVGTCPAEVNPSYPPDRINDRWPRAGAAGVSDMRSVSLNNSVSCRPAQSHDDRLLSPRRQRQPSAN